MIKKVKYIGIVLSIFCIGLILWLCSNLSGFDYTKKVELTINFVGAIIGGGATLIAIYISTKETRSIQGRNEMFNNKQSKTQIINEKIKDYKECSESLKEAIAELESFDCYLGNCMIKCYLINNYIEPLRIVDDKAEKFRLSSKCIQKTEIVELINIVDNNYFKMFKYTDQIRKRTNETDIVSLSNDFSNYVYNDIVILLIEIQVKIREEIGNLYDEKYNL